jgi:hypothetical protein
MRMFWAFWNLAACFSSKMTVLEPVRIDEVMREGRAAGFLGLPGVVPGPEEVEAEFVVFLLKKLLISSSASLDLLSESSKLT